MGRLLPTRRNVLLGAATLTLLPAPLQAQAPNQPQQIGMSPQGFPIFRIAVQNPGTVIQACPEWCWAASSSMLFSYHNHPLDQTKIVARVFGAVVCAGSGGPKALLAVMSTPWFDDAGHPFRPTVAAAYDAFDGINQLNNNIIANELLNNRPLLYANTHHAMVVVSLDFVQTPTGATVISAGVIDPWPWTSGYHQLSPPETVPAHMGGQMTFLAAVHVI